MVAFHELGYDKNKLADAISKRQPEDGSNWTDKEKEVFRIEIFRQRKDLPAVAKVMNKSVNSCMTYYLNSFKNSDDYRLLKTLMAEERAEKLVASEHGVDACGICGDGGSLLICDGCDGEYHMKCMKPPLAQIPEGHWECDDCVNHNFLKARNKLIRNTRVYERKEAPSRKRKADDMESECSASDEKESNNDVGAPLHTRNSQIGHAVVRPKPQALDAVKKFASLISQALAAPKDSTALE